MIVRSLLSCAVFVAALGTQTAAAGAKGLDYEDLRKIVGVSAPEISPDGARVVYVRSRIDWKDDSRDTELVLVDVRGGSSRVVTHDRIGVADPHWSPDGAAIAYLAAPVKGQPAQLYVMPMNGGDSLKITDSPTGIDGYTWRPDSKALAYVAANEAPNKKEIEKHLDSIVITDNDYLTREAPQPLQLWLVNADGTGNARLSNGDFTVVGEPSWSPDGKKLYYVRMPGAPLLAHLNAQATYVFDVAAKTSTALVTSTSQNVAPSHDGSSFAIQVPRHGTVFLTNDVSIRSAADGKELWNADAIDRNVHGYAWLPHDAGLLVETADGVRNVAWIASQNAPARKLDLGNVDIVSATVANDGGLAFVGQRPDRYPEVYYLAPNATAPVELSNDNAWTAAYQLAKTEPFTWMTDMGIQADGVLFYPLSYAPGKKYPLVLDIHGGPVSTSTWDVGGVENGMLDQLLATRGYFVFRPNYRGSDNLGDAFLQGIVGDMASGPGKDNLAAVDALRKTGMIDESRIFVSGWSGGGLQTSWLIGHASFWRAAVSGAAVNDQFAQAVLSDINEPFNVAFFNVSPFTPAGRAAYDAESPITYVNNMKTPLLILSDTRDQRVPVPQAFLLYHALKQRGVPVQFTVFPRYGHFPTDPVGQEQVMRAWVGWIERWSK